MWFNNTKKQKTYVDWIDGQIVLKFDTFIMKS